MKRKTGTRHGAMIHFITLIFGAQIVLGSAGQAIAATGGASPSTSRSSSPYQHQFGFMNPEEEVNSNADRIREATGNTKARHVVPGQPENPEYADIYNSKSYEEMQQKFLKMAENAQNASNTQAGVFGQFFQQHYTLISAMFLSQCFYAATSGDIKVFNEFKASMTSAEFHLSMMVFSGTMVGYERILDKLFKTQGAITKLEHPLLSALALPLGDYVSGVFGDVWNNPTMKAIFKTMEPGATVSDPRDPSGRTQSNSPDVRRLVRQNLQLRLLRDLWRNFWNVESQFNKVVHMTQLLAVSISAKKCQELGLRSVGKLGKVIITPFKWDATTGALTLVYEKFLPKGLVEAIFEAKEVRVTRLDFRVIARLLSSVGKGTRTALEFIKFGSIWDMLVFFAVDKAVSLVVQPLWSATFRSNDIKVALDDLDSALQWYTSPKRGQEQIPWSLIKIDDREWKWVRFFLSSDPKQLQSSEKIYADYWAKIKPPTVPDRVDPRFGVIHTEVNPDAMWNDIKKTMSDFSERFTGRFSDDVSFESCEKHFFYNIISAGPSTQSGPCKRDWTFKHAPQFQKSLNDFKAEMFIHAKVGHVNEMFTRFRKEIILKDVYEKWNLWTKDLNEELANLDKKEHYWRWIARGMRPDDPYFTENVGFWHVDTAEQKALLIDEARMASQFDMQVLKATDPSYNYDVQLTNLTASLGREGGGLDKQTTVAQWILKNHENLFKKYLVSQRNNLNGTSLNNIIKFEYPKAWDNTDGFSEVEAKQVRDMLLMNPFSDEEPSSNMEQQEIGALVRWLIQGMADSPVYTSHVASKAWPVQNYGGRDLFGLSQLCHRIVYPFLSMKTMPKWEDKQNQYVACLQSEENFVPQNVLATNNDSKFQAYKQSYYQEIDILMSEAKTLLYGMPGPAIRDTTKDLINGENAAFGELIRQQTGFAKHVEEMNLKYNALLADEITPGKGRNDNGIMKFITFFFPRDKNGNRQRLWPEDYNVFNQGGENDFNVSAQWSQIKSGAGFYKDLYGSMTAPTSENMVQIQKDYQGVVDPQVTNYPKGTINNFNFELGRYLEFMDRYLKGFTVNDRANDPNNGEIKFMQTSYGLMVNQLISGTLLLKGVLPKIKEGADKSDPSLQPQMKSFASLIFQLDLVMSKWFTDRTLCNAMALKGKTDSETQDHIKACRALPLDVYNNLRVGQEIDNIHTYFDNSIKEVWPDVTATASTDVNAGFTNAAHLRNESLKYLKTQVSRASTMIRERNNSQVTPKMEEALSGVLSNGNFVFPLLGSTLGANSIPMNLVQIFGQQVIQTQNQKKIETRIQCYMLHDQFCNSSD